MAHERSTRMRRGVVNTYRRQVMTRIRLSEGLLAATEFYPALSRNDDSACQLDEPWLWLKRSCPKISR